MVKNGLTIYGLKQKPQPHLNVSCFSDDENMVSLQSLGKGHGYCVPIIT